jgi:predicted amidohydrolase
VTEEIAYRALALQTACRSVSGVGDAAQARGLIDRAITRIGAQVGASKAFLGPDCRLVVLPEYVLTGFPMGEPPAVWIARACLEPGGREYDRLGRIAADHDVWLCGNAYETDEHFPGLYFQACFVIAPTGAVQARYRRLNSMFAPTPHDVWDRYLEVYGLDAVFPVARTPLGNIAPIASEEVLYPEIVRCFAIRGAEVFVHSSSESGSPLPTAKTIARQARALENMAYVVSANTAGIDGTAIPAASADGGSAVVDYRGIVVAQAGYGESMVASAEIDITALRRERRRPGMGNLLSRQRYEVVADTYREAGFYPPNTLAAGPPESRAHFVQTQRETIERLRARGILS